MTVEELATSVISYALWPLLTLAIVGLWVAATMDIVRNRHGEAFTNVKLVCMATLVSVVAVIGIVSVGAVFGAQVSEAVSSVATSDGTRTNEQEMDPARAYLFSFGLEHASYSSPADPRNVASPTSQ